MIIQIVSCFHNFVDFLNDSENDGSYEKSTDVPIDFAAPAETNVEQPVQDLNEKRAETPVEPNVSLEPIRNKISDVKRTGTDKVDLPFVVFDPNGANKRNLVNFQEQSKRKVFADYKCADCAFVTQYSSSLKRHQSIHDSSVDKSFKCTQCDYTCRQKSNLKIHQMVHVEGILVGTARDPIDGLYKCTHCDKRFAGIGHLSAHLKKIHEKNQQFNCAHCSRRFASVTKKRRYENRCQIRHFECYLCKKYVTTYKSHMQVHLRRHSGA